MKQEQTNKATTQQPAVDLSGIREKLDQINEQAEVASRVVNLKYSSCCGCGCSYYDVERTVFFDSELKDGDIIKKMEPGDRFIDPEKDKSEPSNWYTKKG